YPLQYYLNNSVTHNGIPVDIRASDAWTISTGSSAIRVAVVDAGIDQSHPDLNCGGRGWLGWDAPEFAGYSDDEFHPYGNDMHGTAVAGEIAACHNSIGIAGIAPNVVLISVRIFRHLGVGEQVASDASIADGLNWAWSTAQASVISNSWGGGSPSNAITDAIDAATTSGRGGLGTAVIFAAGNTADRENGNFGFVVYPGSLSVVLGVGAIDKNGGISNYSPRGSSLDLVAPSSHYTDYCYNLGGSSVGDLVTTDLSGGAGCNDGPSNDINYTATFGGTSAATPEVAGAAALLLSIHSTMTWSDVKTRILSTADSWGSASDFGVGKLNVFRVLCPTALTVQASGPNDITRKGTYTWTANTTGCSGYYTYQWSVHYDSGYQYSLGTSKSQTLTVYQDDGSFRISVTANSGPEQASSSEYVYNCISGGSNCIPAAPIGG
ncbi:MAG TPA: S8 family serine peptidase, partial [Gemmatimonadales bacterium]|nr:S8 family serine peptidase [Gemmatimonadales bacterium]